jgi:glutaredoxin-like protein
MEKMISAEIRTQLEEVFVGMNEPVQILFFGSKLQACDYCEHTLQLLSEITDMSNKLDLAVYDVDEEPETAKRYHVNLVPGIVIASRKGDMTLDSGVRFSGIPAGHEFSSLINAILLVSKKDSGLSEEGRSWLASVKEPVHLQVFVTTSCPYCPQAVTLAHQMALENENVQAEMVEAMEFNELSSTYGVSGVPHTVINYGKGEVIGAVPEAMLIEEMKRVLSSN